MNKVSIHINDQLVEAVAGESVLEAAANADIYIPHICSHPDLTPQGGCKLCVVEIEGIEGAVCSCNTIVTEGMVVKTNTEMLQKLRSTSMELMLAGHPHDCTSCKAYMNCELQALMQYLGTVHARMRDVTKQNTKINSVNPLIVREMERCIQCGRCVRACNELRDVNAIDYKKKNNEVYIGTENDLPFVDTDCRFCGACIAVCPTGALQDVSGTFRTDIPKEEALIPCKAECPAHIDIPSYVRYVGQERYSDAVGVIREKVPFPHALGYVCNHRCETGCKREKLNQAVSIRDLKRFAVEHDTEMTWKDKDLKKPAAGKKIGVVGGGAAGLTAAYYLNKLGYSVVVHEKSPLGGGMMTYGMPEYRIPMEDIQKEISYIVEQGVSLKVNDEVESVTQLQQEESYDAVLVAIGAGQGKKPRNLPGSDFNQVFTAIETLRNIRLGEEMDLGAAVTIIGGGNVALDCARSLIRKGKKVNIVCLEKGDAMPADSHEVAEGIEEGITLYDGHTNIAILGSKEKVIGLHIQEINSFAFKEGALVCDIIQDADQVLNTDSVIFAAGQETGLTEAFGLELNRFGYPAADSETKATTIAGIYAAGDVLTGTRWLVEAIEAGRVAASSIDKYLGGDGNIEETLVERNSSGRIGKIADFSKLPRVVSSVLSTDERKAGFHKIDLNFSIEEAVIESSRCLQCDLRVSIQPVKNWNAYTHK